ncbi:MAG TPA: transposase [Thermoanaerobaculia bacterium]
MIEEHKRNRLPHWWSAHATYFLTFNLFDAMPSAVAEKLRVERRIRIAELERLRVRATAPEVAAIAAVVREHAETTLDASHGACFMNDSRVAEIVSTAITHFDGQRHHLHAWCVMPNHVHVVFEPFDRLDTIVHSWKSFTSKAANAILDRTGKFWQDDYYDRIIRNENELARTIRYVLENPLRAGLRDWPWLGERASRPQSPRVPRGDR